MPERRLRLRSGRIAWLAVAPSASVASICAAPSATSSPRRLSATAAAVIALPITIPPTGTRYRACGLNTPSATTSNSVLAPASASAISSGQNARGTRLARPRAVKAPNSTMAASSAITNPRLSWSKITLIT